MGRQRGGHRHHGSARDAQPGHRHPAGGFSEHRQGDSRLGHYSEPARSRALVIAVALTGGYALVELIGGLWSGSLARSEERRVGKEWGSTGWPSELKKKQKKQYTEDSWRSATVR